VTVVLANPCAWRKLMANSGFCGCRGDSCACRGIASRGSFDQCLRLVIIRTPIEGVFMLVRGPHSWGKVHELAAQVSAWRCLVSTRRQSDGDGRIVSGMVEKTWPA
jgi:hypothetical protein